MATLANLISAVAALVDPPDHWFSSSPAVINANLAMREYERRLKAANVRTLLTAETELTATTTMTKFTSATTPALPTTFDGPLLVWEKPAADTYGYKPCHSADVVMDTAPASSSIGLCYVWRNREFLFGGGAVTTASVKVKIVYWVKAADLSAPADTVPYTDAGAMPILTYLMAAESCRTRGQLDLAGTWDKKAQELISLVAMQEKESQKAKPGQFGGM